jgi:hypothetical protein
LTKAKQLVAKLQAEVQTVIKQRKQAQAFLNRVEHHLNVVEVDKEDAPRNTITPTKPLNKTPSYQTANRVR